SRHARRGGDVLHAQVGSVLLVGFQRGVDGLGPAGDAVFTPSVPPGITALATTLGATSGCALARRLVASLLDTVDHAPHATRSNCYRKLQKPPGRDVGHPNRDVGTVPFR